MPLSLTLLALLCEVGFGYPDRIFRAVGHPVTWIGRLIDRLDETFNSASATPEVRRRAGIFAVIALIVAVSVPAAILEWWLLGNWLGWLLLALAASTLMAQRSLYVHVAGVARALEQDGLMAGRAAVARIVGRDTERLDEAGVAQAALESLAESFSDGVVAPTVWLALLGLPGAAAYKAINTADSMIGHRTDRHGAFGWAAARLDDLVNLPGSRLSALLIVAAAGLLPGMSARRAWTAVRADARTHQSPNAGWPEAAFAGALDVALGGPRAYHGAVTTLPRMHAAGRPIGGAADIRAGLRLFVLADALLLGLIALLAAAIRL